jgi:Aldo/keto reductase family
VKGPDGHVIGVCGGPDCVHSSCEGSLRRLGTDDYIDVYFQHGVDRSVPVEETWGAMSELMREGEVRYLGIYEAAPCTIWHAVHPMVAVQNEYSLLSREPDALLPTQARAPVRRPPSAGRRRPGRSPAQAACCHTVPTSSRSREKRRDRLPENADALGVMLSPEGLVRIDAIAPAGVPAGDRYPDRSSVDVWGAWIP